MRMKTASFPAEKIATAINKQKPDSIDIIRLLINHNRVNVNQHVPLKYFPYCRPYFDKKSKLPLFNAVVTCPSSHKSREIAETIVKLMLDRQDLIVHCEEMSHRSLSHQRDLLEIIRGDAVAFSKLQKVANGNVCYFLNFSKSVKFQESYMWGALLGTLQTNDWTIAKQIIDEFPHFVNGINCYAPDKKNVDIIEVAGDDDWEDEEDVVEYHSDIRFESPLLIKIVQQADWYYSDEFGLMNFLRNFTTMPNVNPNVRCSFWGKTALDSTDKSRIVRELLQVTD